MENRPNLIDHSPDHSRRQSRSGRVISALAAFRPKHCRLLPALRVVAAALAFTSNSALAQNYPNQTVRIIVPQASGGLNDISARLIQPHLERALKHPVIIENKPGAAGAIGTDAVVKAAPDGHTLLMVAGSLTVLAATNPNLPYDTVRDLVPIARLFGYPFLFVLNSGVPAKTLLEFIALTKQNPDKYNYSTTGQASHNHLVTERLKLLSGMQIQHLPYRGGAPAMLAVARGEAHLLAISTTLAQPHIQSGAVRALAIGGLARDKQYPGLPTVAEQGFPDFEAVSWIGLFAPRGTPQPIVDQLNAHVNSALRDPAVSARFTQQGVEVEQSNPAEFRDRIRVEVRNWTDVARRANIRAE
jgi:tripartite-type tricarboxylate transporter receptor subunit TctC